MKQVYGIDELGYYKKPIIIDENEEIPVGSVETSPISGLYKARWTGAKWVEDITQEEIDTLNNQPSSPAQEERIDMLENMVLMMMEG